MTSSTDLNEKKNKADAIVEVRRIQPADIKELVKVHREAFNGYMSTRIGDNYIAVFIKWFIKVEGNIAEVATIDGRPAGYVAGSNAAYDPAKTYGVILAGIWGILTHPKVWFQEDVIANVKSRFRTGVNILRKRSRKKKANVETYLHQMKLKDGKVLRKIGLASIAVAPWAQGYGLGGKLMKAFEDDAKAMNYNRMQLSVYNDNDGAKHVYEKYGWRLDKIYNGNTCFYIKDI